MKTYRGKRTERGCEVTVDGKALQMRSNLSGNATTAFDWGYAGTGQLSLALLADLLGNDAKAKAMSEAFENAVVAYLPHDGWTMTEYALAAALEPLVGMDGARIDDNGAKAAARAAAPDAQVKSSDALPTGLKAQDKAAVKSMVSEGGPLIAAANPPVAAEVVMKSLTDRAREAEHLSKQAVKVANAALAVADEAHQVYRAVDIAADEAMNTANRAAEKAVAAADKTLDEAKRVLATAIPKVGSKQRDAADRQ